MDFHTYQKGEIHPPQHKLNKLLTGTCAAMLSQPESRIDFRAVMDQGKILLVDLSGLGSEVRNLLGGFMLSSLHLTALSRSALPREKRREFHIMVDEVHRFATDALEDTLMELRKFNTGMTLAHQTLSQVNTKKRDAMSSVGTTIIFNVDTKDAAHLKKDLQEKVSVDDLISLQVGEAIARIGTEVVKVKTWDAIEPPENHFRDRIISNSRQRYCRPLSDILAGASQANRRANQFRPLSTDMEEEVLYDEL